MIYLILIAAVVTLALLYKLAPSRKTFMIICAVLLVVFVTSVFVNEKQQQQEKLSRAQLEELLERQKVFGDWYAAYQKDIDRLDRNWQSYHNIIDGLKSVDAQDFNAEAFHMRLLDLEQDSIEEQLKIHMLAAPARLDDESRELVELVIRKTQKYVDAQTKTISLSKNVAVPPVELESLKLKLQDIMIRESPEGLFTAQEISAIRSVLGD